MSPALTGVSEGRHLPIFVPRSFFSGEVILAATPVNELVCLVFWQEYVVGCSIVTGDFQAADSVDDLSIVRDSMFVGLHKWSLDQVLKDVVGSRVYHDGGFRPSNEQWDNVLIQQVNNCFGIRHWGDGIGFRLEWPKLYERLTLAGRIARPLDEHPDGETLAPINYGSYPRRLGTREWSKRFGARRLRVSLFDRDADGP